MKSNFFKILGVNILIFFLFPLFIELGLRFFWGMSTLKGEIYQTSSNRVLRYELKPNLKTKYETYEVTTNSDGFRGREYSLKREAGMYRIVLIGDSVTFGKYDSEMTLAIRLEKTLSSLCPNKKFEVLNMGVEGYNSIQELEVLKVKGLKYNPDLVVVYYSFNDPDYPEYYFKKNFLNRHSVLAKYILYRLKKYLVKRDRIRKSIKDIEENFRYLYSTESWQYTKEALIEMGNLTAAKGIKMVLLVVPEMSEPVKNFREGYPFWYINEKLEKEVKHPNIILIEPVKEFSRVNIPKAEIAHWAYPNQKGNDIIADYFIKKSQENHINFCN